MNSSPKYQHRVTRKSRDKATPPPLPKEVTPVGERQYVDRWGVRYEVVWNDDKGDPDLRELASSLWK